MNPGTSKQVCGGGWWVVVVVVVICKFIVLLWSKPFPLNLRFGFRPSQTIYDHHDRVRKLGEQKNKKNAMGFQQNALSMSELLFLDMPSKCIS